MGYVRREIPSAESTPAGDATEPAIRSVPTCPFLCGLYGVRKVVLAVIGGAQVERDLHSLGERVGSGGLRVTHFSDRAIRNTKGEAIFLGPVMGDEDLTHTEHGHNELMTRKTVGETHRDN